MAADDIQQGDVILAGRERKRGIKNPRCWKPVFDDPGSVGASQGLRLIYSAEEEITVGYMTWKILCIAETYVRSTWTVGPGEE